MKTRSGKLFVAALLVSRLFVATVAHAALDVSSAEGSFRAELVVFSAQHSKIVRRVGAAAGVRLDVVELEKTARAAAPPLRSDIGAALAVAREDLAPRAAADGLAAAVLLGRQQPVGYRSVR